MSIALIIPDRDLTDLQQRLQQALPQTKVEIWPNVTEVEQVSFALVWKPPVGSLSSLPNLNAIQCFGAGVDAIFLDKAVPSVPIARIIDDRLNQTMVNYLDAIVSHYRLRFDRFSQQQQQQVWKPKSPRKLANICILGLGELGTAAAKHFVSLGYKVSGWSRRAKNLSQISCYHGDAELAMAVAEADVVICLLPLTAQTENLLDAQAFAKFKNDSIFINVARGAIVDDQALIAALNSGKLQAACLDVFRQEPLPTDHPFWQHPAIFITPHISAVTNIESAIEQTVINYQRQQQGLAMLNLIDRTQGY
ncbi:glyoxylate/hydroxypyruvate reductase A [Rheinheimera sp. MMS21-TC3]|uniref:2-hydroxyacid dehydrogenase n=1 Tax=Rheinheimera sp. MMS21-TC3 TaxID=3072790 RepID=UPI0028C4FBDC|nr:glyoxylate/hydroxypyruvate reductase A [Rheinheimera sp. MMS21-TC3]WNO59976.1 glyoxylate/hydroxypyruvate reductase A [Rheinheimera sp. MMS21-TC3]